MVESGYFIRLDVPTWNALCLKMESEGYEGNATGVALFLADVAAGRMDSAEDQAGTDHPSTIFEGVTRALHEHGPTLVEGVLDGLRRHRKGGMQ